MSSIRYLRIATPMLIGRAKKATHGTCDQICCRSVVPPPAVPEAVERQTVVPNAVRSPCVVAGVGAEDPRADADEHQPSDRVARATARDHETD
jgi:hypothetical protein